MGNGITVCGLALVSDFAPEFWNIDFDNLTSTSKLRYAIAESITKTLIVHETRISNIDVVVDIIQDEFLGEEKHRRVKKRVDITVNAVKKQTNETYSCVERFFIAPLAY